MRKFASPIRSNQYPSSEITLSLTQIPSVPAVTPVTPGVPVVTPGVVVESSFDSLICFNPFIEGTEIDADLGGEFYYTTATVLVGGVLLTSSEVVWSQDWSNEEQGGPGIDYSSGFATVITFATVVGNGDFTITATIGGISKSIIFHVTVP